MEFCEMFFFVIVVAKHICIFFKYRNIFLGETFSSYISVHNDSNQVVKDILVKVCEIYILDLLKTNKRSWLFSYNISAFSMFYTQNVTFFWSGKFSLQLETEINENGSGEKKYLNI